MSADTSRVKELTKALETKTNEIKSFASRIKFEDNGGAVVSAEDRDGYLRALNEAKEIKTLIDAETDTKALTEWLNAPAESSHAARDAAASQAYQGNMQRKSLGDHFIESKAFKDSRGSSDPRIKIEINDSLYNLGNYATKDIYGTSAGRTGGDITMPTLGRTQDLGITDKRQRQRRVRDLFPVATTNAAILHGIRETGFTNNAAAVRVRTTAAGGPVVTPDPTDVFGLKPTSNIALSPVVYPVATIAHIMRAHRNILEDEPRLRDFLNRRMVDGVKLAEDEAILWGDGTGENITGIMNVSGVQAYTGLNTDPRTAQIRRAATLAMIAEYEPNGIVVHPLDWEDLELETDENGQYRLAVNIAVGGEKRIWNLDLVATTAMTESRFLLGAFGTGAQLYDREQVNVLLSTEDSDNFQRNAVTLRAEERLALTVDRPESFIAGTLTTPAG